MSTRLVLRNLVLAGVVAGLAFAGLLVLDRAATTRAQSLTADQLVQQGKALLGNRTMDDLLSADAKFQAALAIDPRHPEANVYRSVTRLLALLGRSGSADPGLLDSIPKLLDRLGMSPTGRDPYNWTADFARDSSRRVVLPPSAPRPSEILQVLHTVLLPEIDGALANLSVLSSAFQATLPGAVFSPRDGDQLMNMGEVELYRAILEGARAALFLGRSYDLDANLPDVVAKLHAHTFQITRDLLDANGNFLRPISLANLAAAHAALRAATDSYLRASDLIRARSPLDGERFLVRLKEPELERERFFRNLVAQIRAACDGAVDIDLGAELGGPARVNLNQFFTTGPDLRSLLPRFTADNKIVQNSFPDPTFQGVLPQFTQAEWTRRANVADEKEFILYDDFNAGALDSGRWLEQDYAREVRNGALYSRITRTATNGSNNLDFVNPGSINAISADVTVTALSGTDGRARARLVGSFYQTGSPGGPGDQTGVVLGYVWITQGPGGPIAFWLIERCDTFNCSSATTLAEGIIKSVALGQKVTLSIAYNQALNQFSFGADSTTITRVSPAPRNGPPNFQWKTIGTRIGGSGTFSGVRSITATFDNVKVNGVLYDDFPTGSINPAKWTAWESIREVSAGRLVSGATAYNVPGGFSNSLPFFNQNGVTGIKADVTVTNVSYGGAIPRARLTGYFYNSSAVYNGQAGEVQGVIEIRHDGAKLIVYWRVARCEDNVCNTSTTLGSGTFGSAVSVGQTRTLSIFWDGSLFTFGADGSTQSFNPKPLAPVLYPISRIPYKVIGTRINEAGPGAWGSIKATFDNVFVRLNPNVPVDVPTTISGRIYAAESPSTGLSGASVALTRVEDRDFGTLYHETIGDIAGPDGKFSIALPLPGYEYILSASFPGRQTRFFAYPPDTGVDQISAARIGVVEGFAASRDIGLPLGASIAGRVTTGGGTTPLGGATVILSRYNGNPFVTDWTTTASDGSYKLMGLLPGDYTVSAFLTGYAVEFYNNAPDAWSAQYLSLGVGEGRTNVNLYLEAPNGGISGQVTYMGYWPIANATVQARGVYPDAGYVRSVRTDGNGYYTLTNLRPGRYKIEVRPPVSSGYAVKFFSNASSRDVADWVTVTAGDVTPSINVSLDYGAGAISGFVRDASGAPVLNSCVGAINRVTGSSVRFGCPNGDGSYTITLLPPGTYRVQVFDVEAGFINQYYSDQKLFAAGDDVEVTPYQTTSGVNFTMAPNPGRILGRIRRADTGAPIWGAGISIRTDANDGAGGGTSRADGSYLARGLAPGQYKVRVSHPNFVTRFYTPAGGSAVFSGASLVPVTPNTDTMTIDVALSPNPGRITGRVTEMDGTTPIAGVNVAAGLPSELHNVGYATTRSDGTYEITGLGPGSYVVQARVLGRAVQFYDGKLTRQAAILVPLVAGQVVSNIDLALSPWTGNLSGRIMGSDGVTGLEGAVVTVFDAATGGLVYGATTRREGDFTVVQLPPGTYKVRARALGFVDRFYLAGQPGTGSLALATPVVVTAGGTMTGVSIQLESNPLTTKALSVIKSGTGSGTVSSSPAGISCGSDCGQSYATGTSVTLTATPAAGSTFTGWTGESCSGTGSCIVTLTDAQSVTATFTRTVVTVSAPDPTATERATSPGTFRFTRTGGTASALTVCFTVAGTATPGADYTALPSCVAIPAGANSKDLPVSPVNDSLVEAPETVIVTLAANPAYTVGSPSSATVTILSEEPAVTVTAIDNAATENPPTPGALRVSRTGSTAGALTVYYTVSGTATPGSDYAALGASVSIPAGASFKDIPVTPLNDTLIEAPESVVLTLKANPTYTVGNPNSATVTILSDEKPTVTVTALDNTATENPLTRGIFRVIRTGLINAPLTVFYSVGGTATRGSDYISLGTSVTIPSGASIKDILVSPVNDTSPETSETVSLTLAVNPTYIIGAPSTATVSLTSEDRPIVTLEALDDTATENPVTNTGTFRFTRTGPTTAPLTVFYTVGGTATAGSDYTALGTSVIIPAAASTVTKTVTPINDTLVEAPETVILTLATNSAYALGSSRNATVTILSDERPTVTVTAIDNSAAENPLATGIFRFTRTGLTNAPLTVSFAVGGTATPGSDYIPLGTSVTIPGGAGFKDVLVTPVNDTLMEFDETVVVALAATPGYGLGSPASAIVTITSDEAVSRKITVTARDATATEAGLTTGTFTFTRTGATTAALTVYYTVNGTATPGLDYVSLGTSVTFPAGQSTVTKVVTPLQDSLKELSETVTLTLTQSPNYAVGSPSSATVTITSDEAVTQTVTVAATDPTATEAGLTIGTFTFTRTGATTAALTVYYMVSGTATAGQDYAPLGTSVAFPAGANTVTKRVTPLQDALQELDESVIVTLVQSSTYAVGSLNSATVTIESDEPITRLVTVTGSDPIATEAGLTTGAFTFTRTGSLASPLTVAFIVTGTATPGLDYMPLGANVTFPAGFSTVTEVVIPLQDVLQEVSETVILTLVQSPSYAVGSPGSATVTLTSDEAITQTVTVAATDATATEAGPTTGTFTFTRTGSVAFPLTVFYAVSGTATAGSDYTAIGTSIKIPAGAGSVTKTVTPINDALREAPETVILVLTPSPTYLVGSPGAATVTIVSDETP